MDTYRNPGIPLLQRDTASIVQEMASNILTHSCGTWMLKILHGQCTKKPSRIAQPDHQPKHRVESLSIKPSANKAQF